MGYFKQSFPIHECIKDTETIVDDIEKGVYYLWQGINIKDLEEALKSFGDAIFKIPHTLSECKECAHILDEFKKMAIVFSNPALFLVDVGKNVFWHFRDITKDIHEAWTAWDNKQYRDFGEFIGELIAIATKVKKIENVQNTKEVA